MKLFNFLHKKTPEVPATLSPIAPVSATPSKPKPVIEKHHIAGVTSYMKNIMSIAIENDDYPKTKRELVDDFLIDERVFQYFWDVLKVELIEEADNPHDKNAIKVLIDDVHVGYIKKGSCSHIKKLIKSGNIAKISAQIGGGKYKYVYEDEYTEKYIMDKGSLPIGITLEIELS